NDVLQVMVTQGLVGLAALALVVAGLVRAALQAWRRGSAEDRTLLVALVASATGLSLQLLLSFVVAGVGTLFVTVLALISAAARRADDAGSARDDAGEGAWLGGGIIGAGIVFLGISVVNSNRAEPLDPRDWLAVIGLLVVLVVAVASAIEFRRGERPAR